MSTLIKSATIVDSSSPFHLQKKDILIRQNSIYQISDAIPIKEGYTVVDLPNLHVSSGWFDSSVSFGEPGYEERETIKNGLDVAAKSGFTAIALNPNCNPFIDNKSTVEFLIHKASSSATNLHPIANLTKNCEGKDMAELYDMQNSGAIAFGDYNQPISNDNLLKIALLYAQNFNGLVLSFPKNKAISGDGVANEGVQSTKLGLRGIPALAEELQIVRDLHILEYTGGKLHIPTISTAKSVQLIKEAKNKGLQVTCSVSVHHLVLDDILLDGFDSAYKVTPPLRTKADTLALQEAVKNKIIDCITSDHNPIDIENKKVEFSIAKDGTIGLESAFGALHSVIALEQVIATLTTAPKAIFNIPNHNIKEGEIADITLFNPELQYIFTKEHILSTSKNSAFLGKNFKGKAYGIYANEKLILH